MVVRRSVLLGGWICVALPCLSLAGPWESWLDLAYKALSREDRMAVQKVLLRSGLYSGLVDGVWSGDVSEALSRLPAHITATSFDGVTVVLDNQNDAFRFLREIAQGDWDGLLFEGWGENERSGG
jgi:hypothetical protein